MIQYAQILKWAKEYEEYGYGIYTDEKNETVFMEYISAAMIKITSLTPSIHGISCKRYSIKAWHEKKPHCEKNVECGGMGECMRCRKPIDTMQH